MRNLVIGCDVGTSGTKAVAMTAEGMVLASSLRNYGLITLKNNWAEQWPQIWLDAAVATIAEVALQVDVSKVACVCISALYGGTGAMLNAQMHPVRPAIIWMDRRAEAESKQVAAAIGEKEIFEISGNGIDSYFGYVKLLWVKNHEPELWKQIRHIVPIHSYIVYEMTGSLTADHCSAGNLGGLYDMNTRNWSEKMCASLKIPYEILPPNLKNPADLAGKLNAIYAEKLGLLEGTPFAVGTVDCIASMLSAGVVSQGDNAAVLGTSLNWGYVHQGKLTEPGLISMPYCISPERMTYTYGGASTAGALPRWFVKQFIGAETSDVYDTLQQEVAEQKIPPGSDGLIVLPYFMGERTPIWDENASGVMVGLSLMHTRAHIYRALLESAAYALRHIIESMVDFQIGEELILVGGGAKSSLWQKIFADVTGMRVLTMVESVEAPLGDAYLAAMAVGLQTDFTNICKWVRFHEPVLPDAPAHMAYNEYYKIYRTLYPELKNDMGRLKHLVCHG